MATDPKLKALNLWLKGLTYTEIGRRMGYSRQRAQQIIAPPTAIRNAIKKRAEGRCEHCGVELEGGHIHHLGSDGRTPENYNDMANLVYLCILCHGICHAEEMSKLMQDRYWKAVFAKAKRR